MERWFNMDGFSLTVLLTFLLNYSFSLTKSLILIDDKYKVPLDKGDIIGKVWSLDSNKYDIFFGIPYAEPPIGNLRFKKPVPKISWKPYHYEAFAIKSPCLQFMDYHLEDKYSGSNMKNESEDCLYLNIYAPHRGNADNKTFAVIVWIHGGSFLAGSGDTGMNQTVIMENLILKEVILITLNYRLGPLGFFSTPLPELKGNVGLWDQIEALKWVKENIAKFGGDPHRITIMGESAGGASVSILAISPLVQSLDLVHGAIIMSGSAAAGWAVQRHGEHNYEIENIFSYLACEKRFNKEDLIQVFRGSDVHVDDANQCNLLDTPLKCNHVTDTIQELLDCITEKTNTTFKDPIFRKALAIELGVSKTVVDGEIIPYNIDELLKNGTKIPIMTGVAESEWGHKKLLFYGFKSYRDVDQKTAREKIQHIMNSSLKSTFNEDVPNRTMDFIINAVMHNYVGSKSSNRTWEMSKFAKVLQTIESDLEFVTPCYREASAYANSGQNVFLYSFEHVPQSPVVEEEMITVDFFGFKRKVKKRQTLSFNAAFHGLDHAYIFTEGYSGNYEFKYDEDDYKVANLWSTFITNFAKYGNPTPFDKPVDGVLWTPFTVNNPTYLKFKYPPQIVEDDFRWSNVSLWQRYMPNFINELVASETPKPAALTSDERVQLEAYRRAWWALWILVAAIAFVLWTVIICMVAQKCISAKSKPYKNIIVANG